MSEALSPVGKKRAAIYAAIVFLDIVVVALAARVNIFQEFFFMADMFPFALSIVTLALLFLTISLHVIAFNSFLTRPLFETVSLFILSIAWLASNAFSTSRWQAIPLACASIPSEFAYERAWCRDVQALKAMVWILFVVLFLVAVFTLRYVVSESRRGRSYIWDGPLSQYNARAPTPAIWDSDNFHPGRATMTDYFGRDGGPYVKF
ncbi:hypothetical protein CERSUDRAFT_118809 [Gelatoporia subvermispora B]|uniref:MARVEL domain-containing protein n=1 Tax=Ceriporiopsis subvermispora (strain B) TaxID=914234 RepID=M2Q6P0_CERS8|nr:hypothetical protein CERSUDRAFT_118809 [Gelatoporia subvermispora B]